ncbi:MAG TPA: cytochrome P450 [Acidimicrobiales bacterium]|nr:cytochrome P450 [Acidimicrobiales bacterium]
MSTYAGDPAWHVTGYEAVSRLLADARLGRTHPHPDRAPRYSNSVMFGRPQPATPTEAADHARMRRLLTPWFSPARMAGMRRRVQELVDLVLDDLASQTAPADFHEAVSFPLPALVICELLGVPYEDRERFRRWSDDAADMGDEARSRSGLGALWHYMVELVDTKRRRPGEDVLSYLIAAQQGEGTASATDDVAMVGAALLFAGHETTVAAIDKGVVLLATRPGLGDALRGDPALVEPAVEEILRLPLPVPTGDGGRAGLPRWAKADVEIDGAVIRAGELVLLDIQAANLDPRIYGSAEALDVRRSDKPHLAFGRGPHFCLGAPLARMELHVLVTALVRRWPTLEPAVPVEELRPRNHLLTGGLHALPVRW